ncbi:cryptochrome/photolyase family protein [Halopenitus salinus]|uniref:Cryptochrome/photolyase family protein n=1 Tax=Halopenitus salinus TaxID=1198295 RepID=A0ABD5UQS8_9EURY
MELFWHRRDVRLSDNVGLAAAADRGPVVPCFVFDDDVLEHAGAPRVRYLIDSLSALREDYRDRGSDLVIAHGDPASVIPEVADALGADRVIWNEGYSGLSRERDARVETALDDAEVAIDHETHHDAVLQKPGSIRTNDGEPYSVFTYYWRKWHDRAVDSPARTPEPDDLVDADRIRSRLESGVSGSVTDSVESAEFGTGESITVGTLPAISALGFEEPDAELPPAGTEAARSRLEGFCEGDVFRYEEKRDLPAEAATSKLSQDLSFGTIGIREAYAATEDAMARARESDLDEVDLPAEADPESSVEEFQRQLAWREFYMQVLRYNPDTVSANYKTYENPIEWRDDPEGLAAWKRGETGYPIVDAGMRQLRAEAYMHNRVRMIVASFLTKDLLVDWREGYAHFRERLCDHDTANDVGGWQWAASTGTDAQPYFRIFNPMTQGERYDPDAEYIAEYVPELRGVDPDLVHEWHELDDDRRREVAPEYPAPIVDHSERRETALAAFEAARGED